MKRSLAAFVVLGLLATLAVAQPTKLDQAIAKAEEQLQKGKHADAVKTITKAAASAGAEGQIALARIQERVGDLDAAAAAYEQARATASGPAKADILAAVATFKLRRGKAADALAVAKQAVEAGATPAALAVLARAQIRMQEAPAALATADKALAAGATSAAAHEARGEALMAVGKPVEAEAELRKATELDPKSPLAQLQLALDLIALKRNAEAVAAARRATEIDDKLGEAFAALGLALVAADPQKNWSEAIGQAQQGAALLDIENPFVHTAVGKIFEVNGQLDQAATAYRKALQNDPLYGPARAALIQAEINRGNRDSAIKEVQGELASGRPVAPELLRLVGEDAVRRGDFATAIPYLEKATRSMQGNADGWALLGRAYHGVGRYPDAAGAYQKAVELAPDNVDYRATYGLILGQADELDKGLAELLKVTSTPGYKDAAGWTNLGWVYRNLDPPRLPESISAYQKALELDPKQEQAALGLGWAYSYVKEYDKAIAAYNQAIRIDAKNASADANMGIAWCYFFKRQVPEAEVYMQKAAAAGRNVATLQDHLKKLKDYIAAGGVATAEQAAAQEKAQKEYEDANRRLAAANRALGSGNAANRARGCKEVAVLAGASALNALVQLMQTDPSYDVRIACTQALGTLGAGGRPAVRNVEAMQRLPKYQAPLVDATKQDLDNEMKDDDWRRALRDTLVKIR